MLSKFSSHFIFTLCQLGAESALKKELGSGYPEFKFAYSQPGFITFKREKEVPFDFELKSIFSRSFGVSLSQIQPSDLSPLKALCTELTQTFPNSKPRLHVWERDFYHSGEEPLGFIPGLLAQNLEKQIRKEFPDLFEESTCAALGNPVLDIIVLEENRYWMGAHLHSAAHSPWPGGRTPIQLPESSPSRAYLKLEECLRWSEAPLRPSDTAIEIGSAPGGASLALLNRGLKVIGIDPAEMAPQILKHRNFFHIRQPVNSVLRETLPESIQWLLLDMNVEPRISLFSVDRLVSRMPESLLGVFLTVKLNQWKIADEIPQMLDHVRAMGMKKIKVAQLSHHRQEIIIYGLTRKGLLRKH